MAATSKKTHHIGALAADFGLNPKTIRYYEDIGLLTSPKRTASGYRVYGEAERDQLDFILKARGIGLTLEEIGEILAMRRDGQQPCEHVVELLDKKLDAVDSQLRALHDFRGELAEMRADAAQNADSTGCVCGIIEHHETDHPSDAPRVTLTPLRRSPERN